jgi:hypothetical protein
LAAIENGLKTLEMPPNFNNSFITRNKPIVLNGNLFSSIKARASLTREK